MPPWHARLLLALLAALPLASSFLTTPPGSSSSRSLRRRLSALQPQAQPQALHAAATPGDTNDAITAAQSQLLVLFKGGPAGNSDRGTSLACLRDAEFRGLARSLLSLEAEEGLGLAFSDALETDLSLAAGTGVRTADEEDEDDGDESSSDSSSSSSSGGGGGSSSLMYVRGVGDAEALRRVASRAVLVHAAYEIWAVGPTLQACAAATNALSDADPRLAPFVAGKGKRWAARCLVFGETCGRRKSLSDLPQKLERFRPLLERLPGRVDLKRPELLLTLLEDGDAAQGERLHKVFLARELCRGAHGKTQKLSLKRRRYVTTTSMDAKMSLVMANVAGLREGEKVLDPFAGSGGLLLAAAEMGAGATVGVDVNCTIDLGKVSANFEAQGLAPPARYLFGDAGSPGIQAELRALGPFDVILADPPYGKREKGAVRAEGAAQEAVQTLVAIAASELLPVGGRAVFFVPAHPSCPDIRPLLPTHPCLELLEAARQPLNANLDRWLVALQKRREPRPGEAVRPPDEEGWMIGDGDGNGGGEGGSSEAKGLRIWHYRPPSRDGGG